MQTRRHDDSFLVRIWRENGSDRRWRASVTHLATGELCYFTNYDVLLDFLDQWVAEEAT